LTRYRSYPTEAGITSATISRYITMKDILQLDEERIENLSETILDAILEKYRIA